MLGLLGCHQVLMCSCITCRSWSSADGAMMLVQHTAVMKAVVVVTMFSAAELGIVRYRT